MSVFVKMLREPLVHFLALGAGLFALFYQVADPADNQAPNRIVITQADSDRLAAQWQRQWKRPPTASELESLIDSFIREEILYREALALGLDKDDVIIRRRLGQKLEFLFKDLAEQIEPDDEELERFLEENADRYTIPARYSFDHIYFNRDRRGTATVRDAQETLTRLTTDPSSAEASEMGDPFLYQYRFDRHSPQQISRIFGQKFADRLPDLEPGSWQGPIESGYGLHLVLIRERIQPRQPALEEVRDKVRWDVIAGRRAEIDTAFFEELRQRYEVEMELEDVTLQKVGGASAN